MKEKIKISDIAKACGVSTATVSLVLNNRPGVSEETRKAVLETCQTLGVAVSLPLTNDGLRFKTIGMVVKAEDNQTPHTNPFYSQVMAGIEQACREQGINLLYAALPVDKNNHPTDIPPLLNQRNLDGLLMVGAFLDSTLGLIRGYPLPPLVLVDGYSEEENHDVVNSDNFHGVYQAAAYLISRGHQQIALVGGEADAYLSLRDRRFGYLRCLKDHGLTPSLCEFNINQTRGEAVIKNFLTENPQITAVIGINDQTAVDVIHGALSLGKNVPADLSVVGYDDTYLAKHVFPQLTTMSVDSLSMGQVAVQLLTFRLSHPQAKRMSLIIHPTLVERDSAAELK